METRGKLICCIAIVVGLTGLLGYCTVRSISAPFAVTPWQSIGGCGAGGSGGGSGGIKWVGETSGGNLLRLEVAPKVNFGQNFLSVITAPRLVLQPRYGTEIGLSLPMMVKSAEVQPQTNIDPKTYLNAGRGDLTVDVQRTFGLSGQFAWSAALTFPTGQSDARRGTDRAQTILPASLQKGQGVYGGALGLSYTHDVNNGFLFFEGALNYPFMVSLTGENSLLDSDYAAYQNAGANRRRFHYRFKPYGESDRGDYYPPVVNISGIYALRSAAKQTHSVQLLFSCPLGARWIHSYVPTSYDPYPDPDHRAWDLVLAYGLELGGGPLPVFLGLGVPIHDKRGTPSEDRYDSKPFTTWNSPDWRALGEEWIVTVGFKAGMF
jgi:hypothetical protein